jgi:hypothetical protein
MVFMELEKSQTIYKSIYKTELIQFAASLLAAVLRRAGHVASNAKLLGNVVWCSMLSVRMIGEVAFAKMPKRSMFAVYGVQSI